MERSGRWSSSDPQLDVSDMSNPHSSLPAQGRIPTETSDSEVTSDIDVEPVKPSVQMALKDTTVTEGQSARLDCVIVGQPEPEVSV